MKPYVVYIDIVFLVNFLMDYLLLWATARFTGFTSSLSKLIIGALIGTLYSLVVFYPALHHALALIYKIFFSAVMVFTAFYPLNVRNYLKALTYFYFLAFAAGGAMLGAIHLIDHEAHASVVVGGVIVGQSVQYTFLVAAAGTLVLIALYGASILHRSILDSILYVPIVIRIGAKKIPLKALVDTGNNLKDPISGMPVIIAEFSAIADLLPQTVENILKNSEEPDINLLTEKLAESNLAKRIRVIPFTSIGRKKGMLVGIRPDEIFVIYRNNHIRISKAVIGIYHKRLSSRGDYRALLHPDILRSAVSI